MQVPVVDSRRRPLMPCSPKRARKLVERGDATPFWSGGVFCVRLNREPSGRDLQEVVVAVDPGSKREAYSVKSKAHDLLNVTADAQDWVGRKLEGRRSLRRARRYRKTPWRSPRRSNDRPDRIPTGTRARWEWKYRVLSWLAKLYPVGQVVVEDVAAVTKKGKRRWNAAFSPLEVGKRWLYGLVRARWPLVLVKGHETGALRGMLGLRKSRQKLADVWEAHCVDTWALAWAEVGGVPLPKHRNMLRIVPIQRQRRCLFKANTLKGGIRRPYGGTNKGGLKTGTLVRSGRYGLCYTGGASAGGLSLHHHETGKRLTQGAKVADLKVLRPLAWRAAPVSSPA